MDRTDNTTRSQFTLSNALGLMTLASIGAALVAQAPARGFIIGVLYFYGIMFLVGAFRAWKTGEGELKHGKLLKSVHPRLFAASTYAGFMV